MKNIIKNELRIILLLFLLTIVISLYTYSGIYNYLLNKQTLNIKNSIEIHTAHGNIEKLSTNNTPVEIKIDNSIIINNIDTYRTLAFENDIKVSPLESKDLENDTNKKSKRQHLLINSEDEITELEVEIDNINNEEIIENNEQIIYEIAYNPYYQYDTTNIIVNTALSYVNKTGYNCIQIANFALSTVGKSVEYPADIMRVGTQVFLDEIKPGDFLYYTNGGLGFSHIAVYIGNGMAVHGGWYGSSVVIYSIYLQGSVPSAWRV